MPFTALVANARALRTTVLALVALGIFGVVSSRYEKTLWVNLTDSEPKGVYRLHGGKGVATRGELVLMEVPEEFHPVVYGRHWLPAGWPLIKHVGAVAGDVFCVDGSIFTVNGARLGRVFLVDLEGLPLPRVEGCRAIPAGTFLPVALGIERSFDGRYMGPVAVSRIRGRLTPIFTF